VRPFTSSLLFLWVGAVGVGCGGGGEGASDEAPENAVDPRTGSLPPVAGAPLAPGLRRIDDETVEAAVHLIREVPPRSPDGGAIQVVVENPAGTSAKFEVDDADGRLRWERRDGALRIIDYLPYPANYGFVPRTRSATAAGGDGDPLDVFLLGPAEPRGRVVRARLVGALRATDQGERDDKLLAIPVSDDDAPVPLSDLEDATELRRRYPKLDLILCLWLASYDAAEGGTQCEELVGREEAREILDRAMAAFSDAESGADP